MSPDLDDFELPADLQQIASQLTREAGELAGHYPPTVLRRAEASVAASAVASHATWLRRILGGGLAASLLIGGAIAGGMAWQSHVNSTNANPPIDRLVTDVEPLQHESAKAIVEPAEEFHRVSVGLPDTAAAGQLSAPEWEAVLDLTPAQQWEGVELSL